MTEIRVGWLKLPITGAEARRLGVPQYFTGKPCVNGHVSPRRAVKGDCLGCKNAMKRRAHAARPWIKKAENDRRAFKIMLANRRWVAANRERHREYHSQYRARHRQIVQDRLEAAVAALQTPSQ